MSGDPARSRVMVIGLARLGGVALVMLGILIARRVIEGPVELGYLCAAAGMAVVFLVPQILARRWRSPRE